MSDDDDQACEECKAGAPAWVMTFADLMSLLMCFFVLLLAFSEMDLLKFKQLAGSMNEAFGVQNVMKVMDIPKGTSIIAQEFSPGTPDPTPVNEIMQTTATMTKNTLEVICKEGGEFGDHSESGGEDPGKDGEADSLTEAEIAQAQMEIAESKAQAISEQLSEEMAFGQIEVITRGGEVVIRVKEQGSFGSGDAELEEEFFPIIYKIRDILSTMEGVFHVEGHSDNIPINTARFRSNWELSSARAVSVAHELMSNGVIDERRFRVSGFADTKPLEQNDSPVSRAKNRRVEIVIEQGTSWEEELERDQNKDYFDPTEFIDQEDKKLAEEAYRRILEEEASKQRQWSEEEPEVFEFSPDEIF